LLLDSSQLLLGKRSGEDILIGDVGSDVFLGTEFLCLRVGDKSAAELFSKDVLRGTKVVGIDIGHG